MTQLSVFDGVKERDRILAAHSKGPNAELLEILRVYLRSLYAYRANFLGDDAYVTADDARAYLAARMERHKAMGFTNMKFMGSLFKPKEWVSTGKTIHSTTRGRHANRILCWQYNGTP